MSDASALPPEALDRCRRNYIEAFWEYIRVVPGAQRRQLPGAGDGTLLKCAIRAPIANMAILGDSPGTAGVRLREAAEFFGPKTAWSAILVGSLPSEVAAAATALGLRPAPAHPGMVLAPLPGAPTLPAGLTVRTVATAAELRDFGSVWCAAFRAPRAAFDLVLPAIPSDDPVRGVQSRLYVGYADGRPVACSSVIVTERVAGVVSVGTVAKARGRGYGTAMTAVAVEGGRALGADIAFLSATDMGYRVYEKMGFRKVAELPQWEVPMGFFSSLGVLFELYRLRRAARTRS